MLPFCIEDVNHERVLALAASMASRVNDDFPVADPATNIANAAATAVVCVAWLQKIAFAMRVDATELFEGIADAIDDGELPNFE